MKYVTSTETSDTLTFHMSSAAELSEIICICMQWRKYIWNLITQHLQQITGVRKKWQKQEEVCSYLLLLLYILGDFQIPGFSPPFLFSGRRSSKRSFCLFGILSLCLLGAFLLARLTTFGIYCKLDCSSIFLLLYSPKIINSFLMKFYWNLTNMVTFKSRKSHKFKICKSF